MIVPTSMAGATLAKSVTPESEFVVAPVACMARKQYAPLLVDQRAGGQANYTRYALNRQTPAVFRTMFFSSGEHADALLDSLLLSRAVNAGAAC